MATRWENVPALNEDVERRTAEDVDKVRRRMNVGSSGLKGGAREAVREAGDRAARRLGTRAGLAGMAAEAGYGIGRKLEEETGIGKKLVDKTVGPLIDKLAAGEDRVELSKESKERIARGDLEPKMRYTSEMKTIPRKRSSSGSDSKILNRKPYEEGEGEEAYAKGGSVGSASRRADGCAQRGKTKGRIL